ncbi:MAG: hypothetical protein IKX21_01520, partial [Deltaproteobacteria bacterium]|nr:hypothetical protein [Deltaproteobacteria bacterium]
LFAKEGGQWVLEAQGKNLELGGAYGEFLGKPKQIEVGRGKYGFLSYSSQTAQGCQEEGYLIVMPYNGALDAFGFDFGDGVGFLTVCMGFEEEADENEPKADEKCKDRKHKPAGEKQSVDGGVVIGETILGGKIMTVDTGAEYYDIVVQGEPREEPCEPVTWQTHRFRFENGEYKKAGAK